MRLDSKDGRLPYAHAVETGMYGFKVSLLLEGKLPNELLKLRKRSVRIRIAATKVDCAARSAYDPQKAKCAAWERNPPWAARVHPGTVNAVGGRRGTDVVLHEGTSKKCVVHVGAVGPSGCS